MGIRGNTSLLKNYNKASKTVIEYKLSVRTASGYFEDKEITVFVYLLLNVLTGKGPQASIFSFVNIFEITGTIYKAAFFLS